MAISGAHTLTALASQAGYAACGILLAFPSSCMSGLHLAHEQTL